MIAALRDQQHTALDGINQAVAVVDPPRPETSKLVFQWLRLADAGKRIALDIADQLIDASKHGAVGSLPVKVIFPAAGGELNHCRQVS